MTEDCPRCAGLDPGPYALSDLCEGCTGEVEASDWNQALEVAAQLCEKPKVDRYRDGKPIGSPVPAPRIAMQIRALKRGRKP